MPERAGESGPLADSLAWDAFEALQDDAKIDQVSFHRLQPLFPIEPEHGFTHRFWAPGSEFSAQSHMVDLGRRHLVDTRPTPVTRLTDRRRT